jgi:hypothetical protein
MNEIFGCGDFFKHNQYSVIDTNGCMRIAGILVLDLSAFRTAGANE